MSIRAISAVALFLYALPGSAQQPRPPAAPAPIVQPGAPGHSSKTLAPAAVASTARKPAEADVSFMQGMIHHHAQAVDMVDLLRTRGLSPELKALGERISISQTDEIKYMKQWLQDRGQPVTMQHNMTGMAGMDHTSVDHSAMDHAAMDHTTMDHAAAGHMDSMDAMPLMPGMLTPRQMDALAKAKGAEFDHLFLTGMIQHHNGALIMVDDLFSTPGAGQDAILFDFATDIDNTQRAEIRIMQAMLQKEKQ